MKLTRPHIISCIYCLEPDDRVRSINEIALTALENFHKNVKMSDEEFVSKYRKSIFNDLLMFEEAHQKRGGIKTLDRVDSDKLLVKWSDGVSKDSRLRIRIRNRASVLSWVNDLSNRDYECLGASLMRFLGASRVELTSRGNEFGIDFLAIVPAYSQSDLFVSGSRGIRVVGQSKLYTSKVSRSYIQAFNNLMDSIRHNKYEIQSVVPAWFRNSPSPLVGLWASHSGYQTGARKMAEQNGYILLDTLMMAEIIGRAKAIDLHLSPDELRRNLWLSIKSFEMQDSSV